MPSDSWVGANLKSFSDIPSSFLSVEDIYELLYRLAGGSILYVAVFHLGLDFSLESLKELFIVVSVFDIVFLFVLTFVLSSLASYLFSFVNLINLLLYYIGRQFREESLFQKVTFKLRAMLFPLILWQEDDVYDKNFMKGVQYLYQMNFYEDVDKDELPKPISRHDFWKILDSNINSGKSSHENGKFAGFLSFFKNLVISLTIISIRFFLQQKYFIAVVFLFFSIMVWNLLKNAIETHTHDVLVNFYSKKLLKGNS